VFDSRSLSSGSKAWYAIAMKRDRHFMPTRWLEGRVVTGDTAGDAARRLAGSKAVASYRTQTKGASITLLRRLMETTPK